MATSQGVNFGFTSTGADALARDFRKTGDTALLAAKGARAAADALRASEAGGKAAADGLRKAERAANLLDIAEHELNAELDKTNTKLLEQFGAAELAGKGLQGARRDAAGAGAGFAGLGSTLGHSSTGFLALAAAGVALSPVIVTVGTGLAGLGAAAISTVGPILKAGTATKEARDALASLDPAQKTAYDSLGALKEQFKGFGKALEPQVLDLFSRGLRIASGLMTDITPVTKAVGTALGQVLGAIDKEFRSGTWQQFFQFMASTAGPDVKLLGKVFTDLLHTLPPLLEALQPLADEFLTLTDNAVKAIGAIASFGQQNDAVSKSVGTNTGLLGFLGKAVKNVTGFMEPGGVAAKALKDTLAGIPDAAGAAGAGLHDAGGKAWTYAQQVQAGVKATTDLMNAQQAALDKQTAYGNSLVTTANDAQTFHDKLQASKGMIGLHTQAERDSFGAANTYISDLGRQASAAVSSGHGTDAAITAIRNGLPALDTAKTKNKQYWQEVRTLVGWLNQLELIKAIKSAIHVSGTGQWSVTPGKIGLPGGTAGGPFGAAAGLYVNRGTGPTADDVLVRASKGELIVPTYLVKAGAVDHLRGQIPGFASGGVAGSYGPAAVAGLPPWGNAELAATVRAVARDTAASMVAAINQAKTQMTDPFAGISGVPSGGRISPGVAAAQAFAKSILWAYGWTMAQWPYLQQLWNLESGWRWDATNPSSGAYGIPQSYPAGKMASAGADWRTNPATQIRWGMGYIKSVYGTPQATMAQYYNHPGGVGSYALGGLVPGYATGGSVAQQGQTFLNAWRSRHGGPYALATGPRTLNQQIPPLAAAYSRARALAGAGGLSAGQHRFWATAAASDARLLATRRKELSTEQAWRTQLTATDATLTRQIAAAGNLPGFGGPVRGWKAQIAGHKHTIGEISAMIGLTAAQQAAATAAAAKAVAARPPRQSPFAAWSLLPGPSTATTAGAYRFDQGGILPPGISLAVNNTGRGEMVTPAGAGGGNLTVNLNISGPVGSQRELETWLGAAVDKLARQGRLGYAFRRSSSAA